MSDLEDILIPEVENPEIKIINKKIDITKPLAYFISFVIILIFIKILCISV